MPLSIKRSAPNLGRNALEIPHTKKPCKSTRAVIDSRNSECLVTDITRNCAQAVPVRHSLIVEKQRSAGYFAETYDFAGRVERAREQAMLHHPEQFKLLPLEKAADLWLGEKKLHIKRDRTRESYELYIRNLKKHLGKELLCSLHIGHILTYQQARR